MYKSMPGVQDFDQEPVKGTSSYAYNIQIASRFTIT